MKYEVLQFFRGSPDGRFAVDYHPGEIVELTNSLADVALMEGWVREVKAIPAAPENKQRGKRKK
jgi:hypothetical protein